MLTTDDLYGLVETNYYQKYDVDQKLAQLENKLKYEDTTSRCIIMDDIEKILRGFSDRLRELIRERTNVEISMEDFMDIITWSMEDVYK